MTKSKAKITRHNAKQIKALYGMHGKKTRKKLSAFLFNQLEEFAANPNGYVDWYRDEVVMHFTMLHGQVNRLKPP